MAKRLKKIIQSKVQDNFKYIYEEYESQINFSEKLTSFAKFARKIALKKGLRSLKYAST